DRLELGIAPEGDVRRLLLLLVYARGLRNLRQQHPLPPLAGARARREPAPPLVLERDLLEILGKRLCRKGPWTGEVRRREPAARHEVVHGPGLFKAKHVAVGIAHPEQLRTADQHVPWFPTKED